MSGTDPLRTLDGGVIFAHIMLNRAISVMAIFFLAALAATYLWPDSPKAQLAFMAVILAVLPVVIVEWLRNLYTAARSGYVIPNKNDGPAYRLDEPMKFWSNVVLIVLMLPVVVAGGVLVLQEVLTLAYSQF